MSYPPKEPDVLSSYLAHVRRKRPLSREQERRLMLGIGRGDRKALDELVECNLGFVVKVAGEYRGLGLPFEDMLNEGNLGLIEAARRFDPRKGVKFITYAIWWIRKTIIQAISEKSHLVRVPYAQLRRIETLRRAEARLRGQLGREPTRRDLARDLGLSESEIDRAKQTGTKPFSLARPGREEGSAEVAEFLESVGCTPEKRFIDREALGTLERAFVRLNEQQRAVIILRFGLGEEPRLTLQQAGDRLGVSRERIRQIEKQALEVLRRRFGAPP